MQWLWAVPISTVASSDAASTAHWTNYLAVPAGCGLVDPKEKTRCCSFASFHHSSYFTDQVIYYWVLIIVALSNCLSDEHRRHFAAWHLGHCQLRQSMDSNWSSCLPPSDLCQLFFEWRSLSFSASSSNGYLCLALSFLLTMLRRHLILLPLWFSSDYLTVESSSAYSCHHDYQDAPVLRPCQLGHYPS